METRTLGNKLTASAIGLGCMGFTHAYGAPSDETEAVRVIRQKYPQIDGGNTGIGSTIFAVKPGDGSAREQAASCQKVLGGWANIANEYATKRYRSNLINWGMLPFLIPEGDLPFRNLDFLFLPGIREAVAEKRDEIEAFAVKESGLTAFTLKLGELTEEERRIILDGCLINYNNTLLKATE